MLKQAEMYMLSLTFTSLSTDGLPGYLPLFAARIPSFVRSEVKSRSN